MNRNPDILVIGLGPAGACAAREAAKSGCSVLALDRKKIPGTPIQCAEFVPALIGNEVDQLSSNSVQNIASMLTSIENAPPDIMADFPGKMIDRAAFDANLAKAAAKAGAQCRYGQSIRDISADGRVSLGNGTIITPKVIIGGDGPHSIAGKAIGSVNTEILETRQICVPLCRPFSSTDIFLSAEICGGYGWLFPKGKYANLGLGVVAEKKADLKILLAKLHQKLVRDGRVGEQVISHTGGAIPAGGMIKPYGILGKTLVLLAGDAAGLTNPITGAGINAAVISGQLVGEAAIDWLQGDRQSPINYTQGLEDLFGASLKRALKRRRAFVNAYANENTPTPDQLRASWIAYSDYWAA